MVASGFSVCLGLATFGLVGATSLRAQVTVVPGTPVVGSSNPVSAEPAVTRPGTTPCVVRLLSEHPFAGFNGVPLTYAPPAGCPGPWAKVVFTADFTVSAGRQFDRTAEFFLGNANIFYGTTAEPRKALAPSWHVERDLTDLTALFLTPQTGQAEIGNEVDSTYTGIIYVNATLQFYPANRKYPAPAVADLVVPVSGMNDAPPLYKTTDQTTATVTLPRNVEKVYLDVIAQSQSQDEFWYLNVPNDQTGPLQDYGNTAFRETEVTIDGMAAGVAPVYPWIYTGGIDPYLWEPTVGVQTLNFKPYRVDLTPFAGLLANGAAHTVGISVYNASSYFLATANLLVYTDHGAARTGGAVLSNSLSAAPVPVVTENLKTAADGTVTGTVSVASKRSFIVQGYVNTSHGRVETTLSQTVNFLNTGTFDVNPNAMPYVQNIVQSTTVNSETATLGGGMVALKTGSISYPLVLDYSYVVHADGTQTQVVSVDQSLLESTVDGTGYGIVTTETAEAVHTADTLQFTASGGLAAAGVGSASATYVSKDSAGNCYSRMLTSTNQTLSTVVDGVGCKK